MFYGGVEAAGGGGGQMEGSKFAGNHLVEEVVDDGVAV